MCVGLNLLTPTAYARRHVPEADGRHGDEAEVEGKEVEGLEGEEDDDEKQKTKEPEAPLVGSR